LTVIYIFVSLYLLNPLPIYNPYTTLLRSYRYFKNTTEVFISVLQTAHESSDFSLKQAMKDERPAPDILEQFFAEQKVDFQEQSRSEEHTSELQSRGHLVCRLMHEKKTTYI